MDANHTLFVMGGLVMLGMIGCNVLQTRQNEQTKRLAIEKGFCTTTWDARWVPCATLPPK